MLTSKNLVQNIGITTNYLVPKIRRIERNRLFLYKYLRNVDESFFFFFFQRVNLSENLLQKSSQNFVMKNKLLKLLYVNNLFSYNNLTLNNISVVFVKKSEILPYNLFHLLNKLSSSSTILFLGGILNDKYNKTVFIDFSRFSKLLDLFTATKNISVDSIPTFFNYNLINNIYQTSIIKKISLIKACQYKLNITNSL